MKRPPLLILTALALSLFAGACADLEELDIDPEALVQQLRLANEDSEKPLTNSQDPILQAAGKSPEAIERDREAQRLLQQALESKEPGLISEAIDKRPWDASLLYYQAAFFIAFDNRAEAGRALSEASGLTYILGADFSLAYGLRTDIVRLDAFSRTLIAFEPDSPEWKRLNDVYCAHLSIYKLKVESLRKADFHYAYPAYPESCP